VISNSFVSVLRILWLLLLSLMFWTLWRLPDYFRLVLKRINFLLVIFIINLLLIFVSLTVLVSAARLHHWFVKFRRWTWLRVKFISWNYVVASTTIVRMRCNITFSFFINLWKSVNIFPNLLLKLILALPLTDVGQLWLPINRYSWIVSMTIVQEAENNC